MCAGMQTRVKERNNFVLWGQNIMGIIIKYFHYIKLVDCIIATEMFLRHFLYILRGNSGKICHDNQFIRIS